MDVLEQHQHRLLPGEALHLIQQGSKRLAALLRGREAERGIARTQRDREHRSDQRGDLVHPVGREAQHLLEFIELAVRRLLRRDGRGALELPHERMKRAVAMIGRALIAQSRMRRIRDLLGEPGGKARFADARLTGDQHDLTLSRPGAALPFLQIGALGFTPDKRGEPGRVRRLEPAVALGYTERRPGLDRLGEPLDLMPSEIAQAKAVAEQPSRRRRQNHAAGLRKALQPHGEIRGVADHRLLLSRPFTYEIADHDEPCSDADPRGEFCARGRLQAGHRLGDFEPCMHRPRRIVFMRMGKAEIGQNAVAHEFGDEAVVPRDHAGARVLIGADDLPHVLWIEPRRKRRGADEVAEHDGELAAFGGVGGSSGGRGRRRRAELGDCLEDALARTERQPDFFEIGLRQVGQDVRLDLVLLEDRLVLAETEAPQPSSDVHYRFPTARGR
jgi:hypothetical protein